MCVYACVVVCVCVVLCVYVCVYVLVAYAYPQQMALMGQVVVAWWATSIIPSNTNVQHTLPLLLTLFVGLILFKFVLILFKFDLI